MKFNSLVKTTNWLSVKAIFIALYPDQENNLTAYEEVFDKLRLMKPVEVSIIIIINQHYDDETSEPSIVDVAGINLEPAKDDITIGLAIEFTAWNKWLGMGIDELTMKEFTELEIIAHCLHEMTYAGFEEEEIQEEFTSLKSIADEFKNMTDEKKKQSTISWNELNKRLDNDGIQEIK